MDEKYQKIIENLNILKGNINMANEMLDEITTREALRDNEIVIEMMKSFKESSPQLLKLIEENIDMPDIMNCCLIVNEDLQKTF